MVMKKCPCCGKDIQEGAVICRHCHTRLDEYEQRQEELQYFLKAIDTLAGTPREDYEKEVRRIRGCLEILEEELDVSIAVQRLAVAERMQKEWKCDHRYQELIVQFQSANVNELENLAKFFDALGDYKEAVDYKNLCLVKIQDYQSKITEERNELTYQKAVSRLQDETLATYYELCNVFTKLGEYKDSQEKVSYCKGVIERLKEKEEKERIEEKRKADEQEQHRMKRMRMYLSIFVALCGVMVVAVVLGTVIKRNGKYNNAVELTSNVMPSITPSILENQEKDSVGMVTPSLSPEYTLDEMDKEMYLNSSAYLLDIPEIKGRKITILGCGNKVRVTGRCKETGYFRVEVNNGVGYVEGNKLIDNMPTATPTQKPKPTATPTPTVTKELEWKYQQYDMSSELWDYDTAVPYTPKELESDLEMYVYGRWISENSLVVEIDKDMIWASRYQITRGDAVSYRGYGFSFDYIYEGDSEIHSISYTDDYDGGYLHIDGEEYTRPGSHMDTWYGEDEYYNEQYMESIESSNKSRVYSAAKTVFKENYIDKVYSPVEQIYVSTKYQDEGSIGYSYDYNMDTYNVRFEVAVSDNFGVTWNNFVVQVQFYNNGNGYGVSMFNVY